MAKNIVIAEGGTAKNFTAKKLQTNLQGSGTANWIPEDEAVDYVNLKDHTFRAAGTFNPSDFNCDGFRQVKIDIPADVKPKTITKNGEYYAADDGCLGYSKVTVNVPGGAGGGPFTVIFYDENGNILQKDSNVPYGGNAHFAGTNPTSSIGQTFVGWNPEPVNVRDNMNCYPRFADIQVLIGEITDDWATILEDKGARYPLGSYKSLAYGTTFTKEELMAIGCTEQQAEAGAYASFITVFYKVAMGEGGTTSTWLSQAVQFTYSDFNPQSTYAVKIPSMPNPTCTYPESIDREFLKLMYSHMSESFKNAIKPVIKYTQTSRDKYGSLVVPHEELLWMPSVREMYVEDESFYSIVRNWNNPKQKFIDDVPQSQKYMDNIGITTIADRMNMFLRGAQTGTPLRDVEFFESDYFNAVCFNYGNMSGQSYNLLRIGADGRYLYANQWGNSYVNLGFCL